MLRKAGWAIGLILLALDLAAAQEGAPPEPDPAIPSPAAPTLGLSDQRFLSLEDARPPAGFYVRAEYLLWWVNPGPSPTLLTTAPNNGNNPNGLTGGIIGQPGTTPLFNSNNLQYPATSGVRLSLGINLDSDRFWSLEGSGFFLPRQSVNYKATGNANGAPLLTVPFLDASSGSQQALDISSQDNFGAPYLSGSMTIHSDIEAWGYELNVLAHSIRTAERSFDLFAGFRSLGLDENLTINQNITALQNGSISLQYPGVGFGQPATGIQGYYSVPAGGVVTILDAFSTRNRFYGGQLGGRFSWSFFDRLTVDLTGKVAVGVTQQEVTINGSSTASLATLGAGNPTLTNLVTPGGMFALQNNIGSYSQNPFTIVPEIGLNAGYAVTPWLTLRVGYSALYWSSVARPGAQIDTVLNSKLIPTGGFLPFQTTPSGGTPSTAGAVCTGAGTGAPVFRIP